MRKPDLNGLATDLASGVEEVVRHVGQTAHDVAQRIHLSHWHPMSSVPYNQDVELRVVEDGAICVLSYPCRRLNAGGWINADLGTPIRMEPVEWRVWQHGKSPRTHRMQAPVNDRSALLHTHPTGPERITDGDAG
jgi:hypothetical protein